MWLMNTTGLLIAAPNDALIYQVSAGWCAASWRHEWLRRCSLDDRRRRQRHVEWKKRAGGLAASLVLVVRVASGWATAPRSSVAVVDAALAGACISAMAAPRAPSRWRRQGRGEFADRPIAVADRVGWLRGLLGIGVTDTRVAMPTVIRRNNPRASRTYPRLRRQVLPPRLRAGWRAAVRADPARGVRAPHLGWPGLGNGYRRP